MGYWGRFSGSFLGQRTTNIISRILIWNCLVCFCIRYCLAFLLLARKLPYYLRSCYIIFRTLCLGVVICLELYVDNINYLIQHWLFSSPNSFAGSSSTWQILRKSIAVAPYFNTTWAVIPISIGMSLIDNPAQK